MKTRRVLLLAMSGVRIFDDRLRGLGLTLPGFIERGKTIAELPSLGLLTLAAYTPEGWECGYREVDEIAPGVADEIAKQGWDLVAISSLTARVLDAYALADELRSQGLLVVLGGLHASAIPAEAAMHADAVVTGQGEPVWADILRDAAEGRLRRRYSVDLAARPLAGTNRPVPRYDLLEPARYNRLTLQTMRGCPLDCNFCAASRTIASYQRAQLSQVERELEAILAIWEHPFLELADDNTFTSKARGIELVRLLKRYPVRWFTETDISVADDEALLDEIAESGCAQLLIGLESSSRASLRHVDSRDWKWRQAEHYQNKIERIQSRGISVNGCFILGFDHDDESVFQQTLDMVRGLRLTEVQITLLTPFPGTPLTEQLRQTGRLLRDVYWEQCTLFDVTYEPRRMSVQALQQGFHWLMSEIYSDAEVAHRRAELRRCLKEARN